MTKANHLLAFLAILIYQQANPAPITIPTASPTASSISTCIVAIPNEQSNLHDTACVQDAFSAMAKQIVTKHIYDDELPVCFEVIDKIYK